MHEKPTNVKIIIDVFMQYIMKNSVFRALFLPVCAVVILAKYLEVYGANQNEKISEMIAGGNRDTFVIVKFAFCNLFIIVLVEIQAFVICKAGQIGYRVANRDAFKHILMLEPEKFNKLGKGEMQNIISRKSQAVQDMIDVFTLNFIPTVLTMVFISHSVLRSLGWASVILINAGVIVYAWTTILITEWRNQIRKKLNVAQNITGNVMMDSLYNYETIFTYNSENTEVTKYDKTLKSVEYESTLLARSMYLLNLVQKGVWCILTIAIVCQLCYINKEMIKVEKFTFILSIITIVMKSMDNLGFMYGKFKTALLNLKIGYEYADTKKVEGFRTAFKPKEGIEIKNLSITNDNKIIFKELHCNINIGEKVALIGKNGCGKSTLLKALVKLNKYEGEAFIDKINIQEYTEESLRSLVTYIPQNATLFDDTVLNNIKYNNYKVSDERIYELSKALGIHESIIKMQGGYEKNAGEQGKNLSGGERQKVLILRALLREAPILIMDEATANLDKRSESSILQSILQMKDLTVISIVHNLELLKMFDKIIAIKGESRIDEIKGDSFNSIDSLF